MIAENYESFNDSAMRMSNGNHQQADYILDCSYFTFYHRLQMFNKWAKEQNESMKNAGK